EAERDVVVPGTPQSVELRSLAEGNRRTGVAATLPDAEAQVLAVAHGLQVGELAAVDEQQDTGVAEAERREPRQLRAEAERELWPGHDRVDACRRREVVLRQGAVGVLGERRRERLDRLGPDRQPGGGAVAAVPLEVGRARTERAVEVEGRHRPARALPRAVGARDQHHRSVVALDEPRRDDPDHALVPLLAGDGVAAPAPAALRPRLDLLDGFSQDALLDRLSLAVE